MKAWPAPKFLTIDLSLATKSGNPTYWPAIGEVFKRHGDLDDQGISGYGFVYPNYTVPGGLLPYDVDAFAGIYTMPVLSSANTTASLTQAWQTILDNITLSNPGQYLTTINATLWPDFWAWYKNNNGPLSAGYDELLGSRLLAREHLQNATATGEAFKDVMFQGGALATHLVAGKGVHDAVPRGGSDAVNPAWRNTLIHAVAGTAFPQLDVAARKAVAKAITDVHVPALKKLAPNSGAYINEGDINEPHFQQVYWGSNYKRLLKIKRRVDPWDVFWCHPCVGNERWGAG